MEEKKKDHSFWSTLPGILTGLAAMITAVGAIILALPKPNIFFPPTATPPAVFATLNPPMDIPITLTSGPPSPQITSPSVITPPVTTPPTATPTPAPENIAWGQSAQYDNGMSPAIAIQGNVAVELHDGGDGLLWSRVGLISGTAIKWENSVALNEVGIFPSIAMQSDGTVVQVHQATNGAGSLWYRVGQLSGRVINWGQSAQYDNGMSPAIAIQGNVTVELHDGGDGPLWSRVGLISGTSIKWENSFPLNEVGIFPSIAIQSDGATVQVHQATNGAGPLWYRVGSIVR